VKKPGERKYFLVCAIGHENNAWRRGEEPRPDKCPQCGVHLREVRLIEVDGERILEDERT
jgi:hypothetical protein